MARRIRSNVLWAGTGRILSISFLFALHSSLARVLSAEDYGQYVLLESVVVVLSLLILAGMPAISLRMLRTRLTCGDSKGAASVAKLSLGIMIGTSALTAIGVWTVAILAGQKILDGNLSKWLFWILVWSSCAAVLRMLSELARGYEKLRFSYLVGGQSGGFGVNGLLLFSVITIGVISSEMSLLTMLCIQITIQIACVVPALAAIFRVIGESSSGKTVNPGQPVVRQFLRCSFPLLIQQLVGYGIPEADTMMLGAFSTAREIAIYASTKKLVFLASVPLMLVSHAIQPFIIEFYAKRDIKTLEILVRGTATISAIGSVLVLLVLFVAPSLVLRTFFGDAYVPATTSLRVLCIGAGAFAMTGPCGLVLTMTGHERTGMWTSLALAAVYLVASPFLIENFGILGAAIGASSLQCCANVSLMLCVFYHERFWTSVTFSAKMAGDCLRMILNSSTPEGF